MPVRDALGGVIREHARFRDMLPDEQRIAVLGVAMCLLENGWMDPPPRRTAA